MWRWFWSQKHYIQQAKTLWLLFISVYRRQWWVRITLILLALQVLNLQSLHSSLFLVSESLCLLAECDTSSFCEVWQQLQCCFTAIFSLESSFTSFSFLYLLLFYFCPAYLLFFLKQQHLALLSVNCMHYGEIWLQWPAANTMQNTHAKDREGGKVGEKTTKDRQTEVVWIHLRLRRSGTCLAIIPHHNILTLLHKSQTLADIPRGGL